MEKQSKIAELVISNFRRPKALLPAWVWLHWVEQGDVHNGWPEEPPEGVGGLFLDFGVNPVLLFLVTLPPPHYSFTVKKSWSNRHQEERGREREKERKEFY